MCKNLLHPSSVDPYFYVFIYLFTYHVFFTDWLRTIGLVFHASDAIDFFLSFFYQENHETGTKINTQKHKAFMAKRRWKVSRHCSQLIL